MATAYAALVSLLNASVRVSSHHRISDAQTDLSRLAKSLATLRDLMEQAPPGSKIVSGTAVSTEDFYELENFIEDFVVRMMMREKSKCFDLMRTPVELQSVIEKVRSFEELKLKPAIDFAQNELQLPGAAAEDSAELSKLEETPVELEKKNCSSNHHQANPSAPWKSIKSFPTEMAATYAALVSLRNALIQVSSHHQMYDAQTVLSRLAENLATLTDLMEHAPPGSMIISGTAVPIEDFYELGNLIEDFVVPEMTEKYECFNLRRTPVELHTLIEKVRSFEELTLKPAIDLAQTELLHPGAAAAAEEYAQSKLEEETGVKKDHDLALGFEDAFTSICNAILEKPRTFEVIPIVGMGGVGKTTLAHRVYNNSSIRSHFRPLAWITISQNYDMESVLISIIQQFTQKDMSSKSVDELAPVASKCLMGRRYLIVLDDVWSVEAWGRIQKLLPNTNRLGKVLITTRTEKVALNACGSGNPYKLRMLNLEESIELLKLKVFGKHSGFPPELEQVSKRIAKVCNGLPLAIVVIAGLLQRSSAEGTVWENFYHSIDNSQLDSMEKCMDTILSLSYDHLPLHLKPCFLYLAAFPEDYEIPTSKLIRLWVAEGLITQKREVLEVEETASLYLDELVNRSLLMVAKKSVGGKIKTFRIHDLIHDMCIEKARTECFLQEVRKSKHESFKEFLPERLNLLRASSLLCFSKASLVMENKDIAQFVRPLKRLRIFDVHCKFQSFPPQLAKLIHLRSITLSGNFEVLPATITDLRNLQNLEVFTLSHKLHIKADIWELEHLRHLRTNVSTTLKKGKGKGGSNLQTLAKLSLESFTVDVSNKARNLKELDICGKLSELMCFQTFPSLVRLVLEHSCPGPETRPCPGLPQPNRFPPNLITLILSNTHLDWEHMSILGKLPKLEVLKLKNHAFMGDSWDVADGSFHQLDDLSIAHTNLKYWTASVNSLPKLRILSIKYCSELEEIPLHIGKSLEDLHMYRVTKFAVSCARKIEQEKGRKTSVSQTGKTKGQQV